MVEVNAMKRATRKRVRRTSGLEMNIAQHFWNLLAVAVIGSIVVAFVLVQQHEVKVAHPFQNPKAAFRLLQQDKPFLLYGTAWKEDKTAYYVQEAIRAGFRYIDTAAQPKHYREAGVGEGWTTAAAELKLDRAELFLQTKFSPHQKPDDSNQNGATLPYDPNAELREQVQQSVESSLKNLKTDYIDSLVLHSPLRTMAETLTVWKAMEELVDDGTVKMLGVSNCYNLEKFETIFRQAKHKPWALQNRFYADSNFDTDLRQFCAKNGIKYQSFWTLTANGKALQSPEIKDMAQTRDLTPQTLLYAFLMSLGYGTPLSGTKSAKHMKEDVLVMKRLQDGEVIFQNEDQLRKMAQLLGMPAL